MHAGYLHDQRQRARLLQHPDHGSGALQITCNAITWDWGDHTSHTGGLSSGHTYKTVSGDGSPDVGATITARRGFHTTVSARWLTQYGDSPVGNVLCSGGPTCDDTVTWSSGKHLIEQIEALPVQG